MSALTGPSTNRSDRSGRGLPHPVRGALLTVLLGPVFAVGIVVAATGLISALIAGWIPTRWFSGNAADWLLGAGVEGDAINYVRFLVGGALAAISGATIRWGFLGGDEQR